ncbi:MAG TPA: hypothetical protein VFV63_13145 [Ilumatobacteraceae bacterium]|nr:hypothetical protein [Ilumatobacteraceae bacterium]
MARRDTGPATIHDRLDAVLRLLPEPPPTAAKIAAGAAACAGHWDEVVRLTETATGFDKSLTDIRLFRSEALGRAAHHARRHDHP